MRPIKTLVASTAIALAIAAGSLATFNRAPAQMAGMPGMAATGPAATMHANMWEKVTRAVAVLYPTKGNTVSGTIWFDKTDKGVHIHGTIIGLAPKSVHAFHIHEFGDSSSDDGAAAGGHYNPEGHQHGAPDAAEHHAGDLGNVTADDSGKATIDMTVDDISIADMKDPVIGRGVVLHANADDFKTQPTGNAGGRIAVGTIGIAKPVAP